ncbi:type II toxin-antitoxin system RelE family toxin [Catalinimonas niigatensis]|uniref:type II toxin-antitoxin system RelE family toxin n=1 Tax=Catalinimonas niigatensis TaxID=1397264 RepID=UPI0026657F22|nr:hypothetical protein [Catalinimonas niigatensis]WPP49284.1 hypothetical protein PZB72_21685 [Catalinimonas niigatensis]
MIIEVRSTFEKEKDKGQLLKQKIKQAILNIQQAQKLAEIKNVKKLKGSTNAYRIRIGDYRIGFYYLNKKVILARFKNRKELYQNFPE